MSIMALHTIGADPFPPIFFFFDSVYKEFADNFGLFLHFIFLLLLSNNFLKSFFVPIFHVFVFFFILLNTHLFSLISININICIFDKIV